MHALAMADNAVRTGMIQKALVIGAEALTTIVNWEDRGTCILFGDGAGAAIVEPPQPMIRRGWDRFTCTPTARSPRSCASRQGAAERIDR